MLGVNPGKPGFLAEVDVSATWNRGARWNCGRVLVPRMWSGSVAPRSTRARRKLRLTDSAEVPAGWAHHED